MTVVTHSELDKYRDDNTRLVDLPNGTKREVRLTPLLWDNLEFLQLVEGIPTVDISKFALEEMELQDMTFDNAFRCVLVYLANRWQ